MSFVNVVRRFDITLQDNVQRTRSLSNAISNALQDISIQIYVDHNLDLSRSRGVIDHVTNRFAICHFLLASHWNWASISNGFRENPASKTRAQGHTTHTYAASDFIFCPTQWDTI